LIHETWESKNLGERLDVFIGSRI